MGEGLTPPCPKIVRGQQRLTLEQEAYARSFARERLAAMLSTAPIKEREVEAHLRDVYRAARVEPPSTIRWFDSPLSFVQACMPYYERFCVRLKHDCRQSCPTDCTLEWTWGPKVFTTSYYGHLNVAVWVNVGGVTLKASLPPGEGTLKASLGEHMQASMGADAWNDVGTIVRDSVWHCMGKRMGHYCRRPIMNASVAAFYNARVLQLYQFFHEVFEENKLIHLAHLNEMVSSYQLETEEALVVRKPTFLERDEQGRLHNASGPCVQYRDGWGVYAWHGIGVSEKVILDPEQVTRQEWMQERNAEVRRAIQERLGPQRFIELMGGRCIDKCRRGRLIKIDLGDDPERVAHYVQVQDSSTQRRYYLRVPPSIIRADEAIAWTFGINARDYQPGQET